MVTMAAFQFVHGGGRKKKEAFMANIMTGQQKHKIDVKVWFTNQSKNTWFGDDSAARHESTPSAFCFSTCIYSAPRL